MKHFNYKWFTYHLLVSCPKCGNKIPMQGIQGHPECGDCGYQMTQTWVDALHFVDVNDVKKNRDNVGSKTLFGQMQGNSISANAEGVPCLHCKKTVTVAQDTAPADIACNHCSKPLSFATHEGLPDLVFYKFGKSGGLGQQTLEMVAVRCASCGAPLQADPSKTNYNCQFCHTENILPPSLRRKVIVDDMYIGVQQQRLPADQALKTNGADHMKRVLRENKRSDYTDQQLDEMILKFPNDLGVLSFMRLDYKYTVPTSIYEQLWHKTRNLSMLFEAGRALGKNREEVEAWANQWEPDKRPKKANEAKTAKPKKASSGKSEKYIVIAILLGLAIYFGWQFLKNK